MQRYFFHNQDGRLVCDAEGTALPNIEAARTEAVQYLAQLLRDTPEFWQTGILRVVVKDEGGDTLFAVEATMKPPDVLTVYI